MKLKHFYKIILLLIVTGFSVSCSKDGDIATQLSVSVTTVSFKPEGGASDSITIVANSKWSISNSATTWLQSTKTKGNGGTTVTKLTALSNDTKFSRSVILTVEADNGQSRRITVTQSGNLYSSYNLSPIAPDETGMTSTAVQLAAKMGTGMGMNFGNTTDSDVENAWVTGGITDAQVKFVKQLGFSSVRIPMNWVWTHLSDRKNATIDPVWLARVKQVVGYCVNNGVYVIVNAHADLGWLEDNVNAIKKDSVNAMQKAIWEQIATTLRDFDEHLIFAGTNEPKADNAEQMAILNGYHETFIKAVRSTGGRNSYRVLIVQGPHADPTKTATLMTSLPADKIPNKLMVEVHDYTPYQFTLMDVDASWGKMVYYWGAGNVSTIEPDRNNTPGNGDEAAIATELQGMKQNFVDKGIPVVLGEYSTMRRTNPKFPIPKDTLMHNRSVDDWTTFVTKTAKTDGILPFFWEVEQMLDRKNNVVIDQRMYNAIVAGYK